MAPLITTHNIEVLSLGKVLVVLQVSSVVEVVLILMICLVVTIVEVGWSPWLDVLLLFTIGPVATEVHVYTKILKAVDLVIYFNIALIVIRVCTVIISIQLSYRICLCKSDLRIWPCTVAIRRTLCPLPVTIELFKLFIA